MSTSSEYIERDIKNEVIDIINSNITSVIDLEKDVIIKYANKKNSKILLRKKELFDNLNDRKLEYVRNGICDSYIKFGTPSLEHVIDNIQTKTDVQSKRLMRLIKRLNKECEVYDENISYYRKYIKYGGDLDYTVEEGIKEWFYINKTNYLEFLKIYKDEDKAQAKAFNNYIKRNKPDKYTERIRKSELILRLF